MYHENALTYKTTPPDDSLSSNGTGSWVVHPDPLKTVHGIWKAVWREISSYLGWPLDLLSKSQSLLGLPKPAI